MNLCTLCKLDFGSVKAFDLHKTGTHEYTFAEGLYMEPPREDGRRCLDEDEIAAAKDREGNFLFARNAAGNWSVARSLNSAREAFSDDIGSS